MMRIMYAITLLPLSHKLPYEVLTYYSKKAYEVGTVLRVPLGKQSVTGLVQKFETIENVKQELKDMTFTLRAIKDEEVLGAITETEIEFLKKISRYTFRSFYTVCKLFFPYRYITEQPKIEHGNTKTETFVIQEKAEIRYQEYRKIIREAFTLNKNVLIIAPTKQSVKTLAKTVSKNIEQYVISIESEKPKLIETFIKNIAEDQHPYVVVTTPYFAPLFYMFSKILIIEEEASPYYEDKETGIHMRPIIEAHAKSYVERIILGDHLLSLKSHKKRNDHDYHDLYPIQWQINELGKIKIVQREKGDKYTLFTNEAREILDRVVRTKEKIILFGTRNGLAAGTYCKTCTQKVTCDQCDTPLILLTRQEGRVFRCSTCELSYTPYLTCTRCGSPTLIPYGAGTEAIEEEIKKLYPDILCYRLDKETTPTDKAIREKVQAFKEAGTAACLITTEQGQRKFAGEVLFSLAISCDTLFELPILDSEIRVERLINDLSEKSQKLCLIQTFNSDKSFFEMYRTQTKQNWIKRYLEDLEKFGYPPYKTLIKITYETKSEKTAKEIEEIFSDIGSFSSDITILFKTKAQIYRVTCNLWIEENKWDIEEEINAEIEKTILENIQKTGSPINVEINPVLIL